jgi:protein-S-isoprenylcysteine O-methyltransferase Ste14
MAARSIAGLLFLLLVLGVALFAPAGTLGYWQAWLYLAVFGASAGAITLHLWNHDPQLLERRLRAGPTGEQRPIQRLIQSVASVAFLAIYVVAAFDNRFGWSHVPGVVSVVAEVFVAIGFAIVFLVFRENTYTAATIEVASGQSVISTGPYGVVRHPMYAGALLLLAATPIALGSWWGLLLFAPICLVIVWRLLDEERFLTTDLPGYAEYCANVRWRLVPAVW